MMNLETRLFQYIYLQKRLHINMIAKRYKEKYKTFTKIELHISFQNILFPVTLNEIYQKFEYGSVI